MRRLYQLASPAEGQSVDCCDDRLRKGLDASRHLMARSHEVRHSLRRTRLQVALKARNVGAGAEGTPSSGNHNDAHGGIELDAVQHSHNRGEQLVAERVQLGGAVHRQDRDGTAVVALQNGQSLSVHGIHRTSSISLYHSIPDILH